jgi:hypothetical protein
MIAAIYRPAMPEIAHHEAGHAVAAYRLRLGLQRVTIIPSETGEYDGSTERGRPRPVKMFSYRRATDSFHLVDQLRAGAPLRRHIIWLLAGPRAQERYHLRAELPGPGFVGSNYDIEGALTLLMDGLHLTRKATIAHPLWMRVQRESFRFVACRGLAITAVAEALLVKRTLSRAEVAQLIEDAEEGTTDSTR